ncbi:MAG: hypothetical protein R3C56_10390 [Pirellulaceae bacterium]
MTSILAFGNQVNLLTPKPTAEIEEIRTAIDGVTQDDSGVERVFTALYAVSRSTKDTEQGVAVRATSKRVVHRRN